MTVTQIRLPEVRRETTEHGYRVEPGLDRMRPDHEQVGWKAAAVALETGLPVTAFLDDRGNYSFAIGPSSSGPYDFYQAWTYLNGVAAGSQAAKAVQR